MIDAGNLANCLIGINKGLVDDSVLDKHAEIRPETWHKIIIPCVE